jgi:antirestriction protein ArdC
MSAVIQVEALDRAKHGQSMSNYGLIFEGFAAKGIPEDQVEPRVNVFTYEAWRAQGRQVRKGEHGVRVCTFVEMSKQDEGEAEPHSWRSPRATTVFHVSQTDAIGG